MAKNTTTATASVEVETVRAAKPVLSKARMDGIAWVKANYDQSHPRTQVALRLLRSGSLVRPGFNTVQIRNRFDAVTWSRRVTKKSGAYWTGK